MIRKLGGQGGATLIVIALGAAMIGARGGGCTDTSAGAGGDETTATTGSSTTSSATGTGGAGGGEPCALPIPPSSTPNKVLFEALHATILDPTGMPQGGLSVAVCGKGACTKEVQSGPDGVAEIMVPPLSLDRPTARWGDGLFWALLGDRIESPTATITGQTINLMDTSKPVQAGPAIQAGQATLSIPEGTSPSFDPFRFDTPEKRTLRASALVKGDAAAGLAPGQGFLIVLGLGPAPTYLCSTGSENGGATLTIDDSAGLPDKTNVGFYQFEFDPKEHTGTFGEWIFVSPGVVAGSKITTLGHGLHVIGTVGIKVEAP